MEGAEMNKTYENFEEWLKEHDERISVDERAKIIKEVDMHLRETRYTYDYGMGIGDNIGSALLKEYANGYKKGEQDGRAEERRKFIEWLEDNEFNYDKVEAFWCRTHFDGKTFVEEVYTTNELLNLYEKEKI